MTLDKKKINPLRANMLGTSTTDQTRPTLNNLPQKPLNFRENSKITWCKNTEFNLAAENMVRKEKNVIFGHLEVGGGEKT